ncbi:MAG: hypothetical protein ABJH63_20640 [Rhizobiaceae bacterium]
MKTDLQIRVTVGILQDSQPVSTSALGWLGETIYPAGNLPNAGSRNAVAVAVAAGAAVAAAPDALLPRPMPILAASPPCRLVFSPLANSRDRFNILLWVG